MEFLSFKFCAADVEFGIKISARNFAFKFYGVKFYGAQSPRRAKILKFRRKTRR